MMSAFDKKGRFLYKKPPKKGLYPLNGVQIHKISFVRRIRNGFNYQFDKGCFFDKLNEQTLMGEHLSRSLLAVGSDKVLVLAKRNGTIATVTDDCQVITKFKMNLLRFAIDPTPIKNAYVDYKRKLSNLQKNGLPLIGLAVKNRQLGWVLIRNEHNEDRWLYELNLETGTTVFKEKLDVAFSTIRYSNGALILVSETEAVVRCLLVDWK